MAATDIFTWTVAQPGNVDPSPVKNSPSVLDTELNKALRLPESAGSVFINGKSSYSGADIKVVVHVYDGGKLSEQRKNDLEKQVNDLTKDLESKKSDRGNLEKTILSGNSFSNEQLNKYNGLNKTIATNTNTIAYLNDEMNRLGSLRPNYSTKVLAEIQTLSISSHREKFPVRSLGAVYPKAFSRGSRSIAGSMIFTVFDRNVIEEFLESHPADGDLYNPATTALIDQIPPFDITVAFANELGQVSRMSIYGVEFVNEGQTMSIEDLLLENVTQFIARDYDPMRAVSVRKIDENNRLSQTNIPLSASSLLNEQDYQEYRNKLSPFDRFKIRDNPYT